jgi:wyosine [tRNA(Phe)-imidazoG37] synthetase (radical SAM superfamily)
VSSGDPPDFAFGPVPSRRFGQSLGVNNIPPKHCSYACVYCQLGRTLKMTMKRQRFHDPATVVDAVLSKLDACRKRAVQVDVVTVVPDGEPTLDLNLGRLVEGLRALGLPVAVITNSSLLDLPDVRAELALADLVSAKVDAVDPEAWRLVDRPHGRLRLGPLLDGLRRFARDFTGTLVTETMLLHGVNDGEGHLQALATFLEEVAPSVAYVAVPIRPPAEPWARPSPPERVLFAFELLSARVAKVELLVGDPPAPVVGAGDLERDLLAITAVTPWTRTRSSSSVAARRRWRPRPAWWRTAGSPPFRTKTAFFPCTPWGDAGSGGDRSR